MKPLMLLGIFVALAGVAAGPGSAARTKSYLILAGDSSLPAQLDNAVRAAGGMVTRKLPAIGVALASSSDAGFAARAARIRGIRSVSPNATIRWIDPSPRRVPPPWPRARTSARRAQNPPASGNDDPLFDLQWGLDAVDAPEAWAAGQRGRGARIAVLDTGVDADHPDLAPNVNTTLSTSFVEGQDFDNDFADFDHGSHVAGIVAAADNGVGVIGVAPEAEIVAVKVLDPFTGSGTFEAVIAGIVYAADADADIINMSLGAALRRRGFVDDNGTPGEPTDDVFVPASAVAELATALGRATTYAFRHGTTVITSAGNNASDRDHDSDVLLLPSDSPHVISISATGPLGWGVNPSTSLDVPAFYTNFGQSAVDFAAPGGNVDFDLLFGGRDCTVAGLTAPCWAFDLVLSTGSGGTWFWAAGTSMSAAYASGTAAIIIGRAGGSLRPAMAAAALAASADDLGKRGDDGFYGAGRVNAGTAASQRP